MKMSVSHSAGGGSGSGGGPSNSGSGPANSNSGGGNSNSGGSGSSGGDPDDTDQGDGDSYSHDDDSVSTHERDDDSFDMTFMNDQHFYDDDRDRKRKKHKKERYYDESFFNDDNWAFDDEEETRSSRSGSSSGDGGDYPVEIVVLDRSGSMAMLWREAINTCNAIVHNLHTQKDRPIVLLYTFSHVVDKFVISPGVDVGQVLCRHGPNGSTDLAGALRTVFQNHFRKKRAFRVVVITDGIPNSANEAKDVILERTRKSKKKQIGITFFQVGDNPGATQFLYRLPHVLMHEGAPYQPVEVFPSNLLTQPLHEYFR